MGYGRTYVTHQEGLITEGRCVGANCACAFLSAQPLIKHELSQRSGWCRNRLAKGWGFWKPHREGRKRRKRRKGEGERRYRAPFCLLPYENTARLSRTTKLTLPAPWFWTFPVSRNVRKNFLLILGHPACGILL